MSDTSDFFEMAFSAWTKAFIDAMKRNAVNNNSDNIEIGFTETPKRNFPFNLENIEVFEVED